MTAMLPQQSPGRPVDSIATAIVETVATEEGVDPVDLDVPLYSAIDPDALDRLFRSAPAGTDIDGRVTFTYAGYGVTVHATGAVHVE